MKGFVIFFLDFRYNFPSIFNIISKSFATYGCCHPCFYLEVFDKRGRKYLMFIVIILAKEG